MKQKRTFSRGRIVGFGGFLWVVCLCTVSQGRFLEGHLRHTSPRARLASPPSTTFGTYFIDADHLGKHSYTFTLFEKNGIIYTTRGGHIDIAHLRKTADWTAYLASLIQQAIHDQDQDMTFKLWEPSRYLVHLQYPPDWLSLSEEKREEITTDIAVCLAQHLAYTAATWHEILTWYGYRGIIVWPEFQSSFSWEDNYSNLLGIHVGAAALRNQSLPYSQAVTVELKRLIRYLGPQSHRIAYKASKAMRGLWFKGDLIFLTMIKRNFDIGYTDGYVTPWLVTCLPELNSAEAQPASIPLPNLDLIEQYGFDFKLAIEPREFEKNRILAAVYPDKETRQTRIYPDTQFKLIMDAIRQNATKRYGTDVEQPYSAKNPEPLSYAKLDIDHQILNDDDDHVGRLNKDDSLPLAASLTK